MKPITPQEALHSACPIPSQVIEVFNELINENLINGTARIEQDVAVNRIVERMDVDASTVMAKSWLNVEEVYRSVGWEVKYNKADWGESGPPTFLFIVPRNLMGGGVRPC